MSDRVARLAEIRRKRKAQEAGLSEPLDNPVAITEVQQVLKEETSSPHLTSAKVDEKGKSGVEVKQSESDIQDSRDTSKGVVFGVSESLEPSDSEDPKDPEDSAETTNSQLVVENSPDVDSDSDSDSESEEKKLTYNTDLKRDLAPYLQQAKRDTDRAINRILQEKYRMAVRANFEENR